MLGPLSLVLEALSVVWIHGSFYGFLYPVVVGATLGLCALASRRFRPRQREWFPLMILPALAYYVPTYAVAGRQGLNTPYAAAVVAGVGCLAVVVSCVARRPAWMRPAALVGAAVAVAVWRLVPYEGWTRLF